MKRTIVVLAAAAVAVLVLVQGTAVHGGIVPDATAHDGALCTLCQDGVQAINGWLGSNATQQKIIDSLEKLCNDLPEPGRGNCLAELNKLAPQLNQTDESIFDKYSYFALCTMLSACSVDCCGTPYLPEQIHISLTGKPTEMAVMWTTLYPTPNPVVQYGTDPKNLNMSRNGTTGTYSSGGWKGQLHTAYMTGLKPDTVYYYRVGDPTLSPDFWLDPAWSQPDLSFRTQRVPPASQATVVAVVGDAGATDASLFTYMRLEEMVMNNQLDMLLHDGDISYSDGYEPLMDTFLRKIEGVAAQLPTMVVPGNHEGFYDFVPYKARFNVPYKQSNSTDPMYYSFNLGLVHYINLNSEGFMGLSPQTVTPSSPMYQWLLRDLAAVNRQATPWVVVSLHRPLYCVEHTRDCTLDAPILRKGLEQVFYEHKVDIVMQAHRHNYQTTFPLYNSTKMGNDMTNPQAPIYILNGAAGNKEHNAGFPSTVPPWSRINLENYGFGLMTVTNSSALSWQFIDSKTGSVVDSFTVRRTQV